MSVARFHRALCPVAHEQLNASWLSVDMTNVISQPGDWDYNWLAYYQDDFYMESLFHRCSDAERVEVGATESERPTVKAHHLGSHCLSSFIPGFSSLDSWPPPIYPRGGNANQPHWPAPGARTVNELRFLVLRSVRFWRVSTLYTLEGAFSVT